MEGDGGLRLAGLVRVPPGSLFEAADFARTHPASFLFVSRQNDLDEDRVRSIFGTVFPRGEAAVDWTVATHEVGRSFDILIRASGDFDDREALIDAFMEPHLLKALTSRA